MQGGQAKHKQASEHTSWETNQQEPKKVPPSPSNRQLIFLLNMCHFIISTAPITILDYFFFCL